MIVAEDTDTPQAVPGYDETRAVRLGHWLNGGMLPSNLAGAWSLTSWTLIRPDGSRGYPAGTNAEGQLIYTTSGHVSVHLLVPGTLRFASDDLAAATAVEMTSAWPRYFGYYGRYTVDEAAGTVTHHIEGSSFPNIIGTDQVRRPSYDGNQLVLDADEAWGVVRMQWKRAETPTI